MFAVVLTLYLCTFCTASWHSLNGTWIELDGNGPALTKLAHSLGITTIIVEGIGEIYGNVTDGECLGVSYSLDNSTLKELEDVVHLASLYKMQLYVGIFDLSPNAAYEWTICADEYAGIQGIAFANFNNYHFYITQEPDLSVLPSQPYFVDYDCNSDGETYYFMRTISYMLWTQKSVMFAPYWTDGEGVNQTTVSNALYLLMQCIVQSTQESNFQLTTSVQDGVGSFGRNTSETKKYFEAFNEKLSDVQPHVQLWATIETFLPDALICKAATDTRIEQQVLAVKNSVSQTANFWSYNLPNAPQCPYVVVYE